MAPKGQCIFGLNNNLLTICRNPRESTILDPLPAEIPLADAEIIMIESKINFEKLYITKV